MSIIDQLEETVTRAVLGDYDSKGSVSHISLLEQFYAILAARLALPQVYSQLLRADQATAAHTTTERTLFEQLWQDQSMQQVIIETLATTHHIDKSSTEQLLINAAPLVYQELKEMADGQFLPAFLQAEQAALRPYLPIWSAPIISATQNQTEPSRSNKVLASVATAQSVAERPMSLNKAPDSQTDTPPIAATAVTDIVNVDIENADGEFNNRELNDRQVNDRQVDENAIHANPAAYHSAENSSLKQVKTRTRNQRRDLLVRMFLLMLALIAIALAVWALFIKPNIEIPVEPVVTAPITVAPTPAPPVQVLTPVELIVGVDNSSSLYSCSATVGDAALQSVLQQALNTSFGEQASICELTVQDGVASSIANLPEGVLPDILTMLRSTPFARLHLQNDRLTLEAPDSVLLQQLSTAIRALAPAMVVDSIAPLPLPNNNQVDAMNDMTNKNGVNTPFEDDGAVSSNQYGNDNVGGSGDYQASDDNTGDSIEPVPSNRGDLSNVPRNTPVNPINGMPSNVPSNRAPSNNSSSNNDVLSNRRAAQASGPISLSEWDDMANDVIVAEPAQVR